MLPLGACWAQAVGKQEVLEFMRLGAAPEQCHSAAERQPPQPFPLSRGSAEVSSRGTEPAAYRGPYLLASSPTTAPGTPPT